MSIIVPRHVVGGSFITHYHQPVAGESLSLKTLPMNLASYRNVPFSAIFISVWFPGI